MKLVNDTTGNHFWGFAHANETVDGRTVGHLWNYGLNTWGWEDPTAAAITTTTT